MMSAEITLEVEGQPPRKLPVGPLFAMGRGLSNDLVVNDVKASRNHAVIRLQGDKTYYLLDLGSSNGTLLNGRRVTIPNALKSGDEILVGNHLMKFVDHANDGTGVQAGPVEEMRTQVDFSTETVSILVVDIRNYTPLSEKLPPEYLSKIVGEWFKEVQVIIDRNNGNIDKFIGDAVMAYWLKTRTEGNQNYVIGALKSAIEMVDLAAKFHERLSADYPDFAFRIGCGLNAGKAITGNVGVDARRDFTAVGDCVNVAFRIETLSKELKRSIILTEEVVKAAGDQFQFEDLGSHKLKGKSLEQRVFTVKE